MSDLIRRDDVMLRVREFIGNKSYDELMLVNDLNALPSAEPEQKKGKWIDGKPYVNSHWRVCSVCHESAPDSYGGYNFCPNCGADMRGDR